ncbi:MBL fold metallo-hydrolase [Paenibacillus marinisediminis]
MNKIDELNEFTAVKSFRYQDMLQWQKERRSKVKDLSYIVPTVDEVKREYLQNNRSEATITFIGHCTFLIQLGGLNIITDPVWAMRMGFQKRMSRPNVAITDLPEIDIVLISHNHYDHLHYSSIRRLKGQPLYLVPKGLGNSFMRKGLRQVKEFEWWDSLQHQSLRMTFVPSLHWSRRTLWDTNRSLWGGWVLEGADQQSVYFVGDSGYHDHFRRIGEQFQLQHVLMPIGCYEPEWFMKKQHMTPEEAVRAFDELGGKHFIPMHYDAYRLADDTPREALDRLLNRWDEAYSDRSALHILKRGETFPMI